MVLNNNTFLWLKKKVNKMKKKMKKMKNMKKMKSNVVAK